MTYERYTLDVDAPNNAVIRHYGVFDHDEDDYATTADYCYGMTLDEARSALAVLRGCIG